MKQEEKSVTWFFI